MKYRLVLYHNPRHVPYTCSKIYVALDALARRGLIGFRVANQQPLPTHPSLVFLRATALDTDAERLLGFELSDHSDFFCPVGLAHCDVYFKRNLYRPFMEEVPQEGRAKILPFGLNYACSSAASRPWVLRHWGWGVANTFRRSPREAAHRLGAWLDDLQNYASLPDVSCFEQDPETPVKPTVLFQTRVWEPQKTTENLAQINEERVALIRQLRKALGTSFHGGIVPTRFARQHYPDVLLTQNYRQKDYITSSHGNLIGIYTRGLHNSFAFKLPEYLAASMCMVSEPLRNELPQPLAVGQHYLEFRSHDECIAHCERLLNNPAEAADMRRHNFAYYRQWVAPPEHLLDCLQRAFAVCS